VKECKGVVLGYIIFGNLLRILIRERVLRVRTKQSREN